MVFKRRNSASSRYSDVSACSASFSSLYGRSDGLSSSKYDGISPPDTLSVRSSSPEIENDTDRLKDPCKGVNPTAHLDSALPLHHRPKIVADEWSQFDFGFTRQAQSFGDGEPPRSDQTSQRSSIDGLGLCVSASCNSSVSSDHSAPIGQASAGVPSSIGLTKKKTISAIPMRRDWVSRSDNLTPEYVGHLCAKGNEQKKEEFEQEWNMPRGWESPYLEKFEKSQAAQRFNWFKRRRGRKATKVHYEKSGNATAL